MDTNTIIIISTNIAMVVALFIGIMNSNANLSNKIEKNNDKIDNIKDELHNFKLEVKDELTNLKVEVANVKAEVSKQNANFGIIEERNTTSTKKLTEQLIATNEQLISIKEQVSVANEQLIVTKEQIAVTNQRTDKLEAEVKEAKFEFRNITKELIKAFPKFSTNEVAKEPQLAT